MGVTEFVRSKHFYTLISKTKFLFRPTLGILLSGRNLLNIEMFLLILSFETN